MIIGFIGAPRTFKTCFMVFHAYQTFLEGADIMANLTLKYPFKYTKMSPYDMLKIPFTNMDREKKTLMIQEIDKWFNARRSMRNENVLLGSLTGQSGKRNLSILWDTQFPHLVDNQVRLVTDMVYHCEVPFIDKATKEPLAIKFTKELSTGEMLELPLIPEPFFRPIYNMYDSYEPTMAMTQTKTMKELNQMYNPDAEIEKKKPKRKERFYS